MKKKVLIVTILDVANFGTMLQAYALGKCVRDKGYDVEFLNYTRPAHSSVDKFNTFLNDKSLGNFFKRFIFATSALLFYSFIRKRSRRFVSSEFPFSKPYRKCDNSTKYLPYADIYMTGSDQVWNTSYNNGIDRVFFLDFAKGKKVSYAASVGMYKFPDQLLEDIKLLLKDYSHITIRESMTAEYFRSIGFPETRYVLDPTLLLNMDQWKTIIHYKPHKRKPYLLVYSVERFNNDFIFEQARKIAHDKQLDLYAISATYPVKARSYGFNKIIPLGSLNNFLSLMIDADFVVASSFHGTAFSVNFNKDFITIAAKKFNIRMESFVNQFDIAHRIISTQMVNYSDLKSINYNDINLKLIKARETSHAILSEILSE